MQLSFSDFKAFEKRKFSETKLFPHFYLRKNYICHIRILIYYLENGLILNELHNTVSCRQKPWLKKYINHAANLRSIAKDKNQDFLC